MEEWERLERRWKITVRIAVGLAFTAVMFLLLMFVARHSGGKAQDQFSIICGRMIEKARREKSR